jgi:hypothetical protein
MVEDYRDKAKFGDKRSNCKGNAFNLIPLLSLAVLWLDHVFRSLTK